MSRKKSILKAARFTQRHYIDIQVAIEIAHEDTGRASTKRSYTAAAKAMQRLMLELKK